MQYIAVQSAAIETGYWSADAVHESSILPTKMSASSKQTTKASHDFYCALTHAASTHLLAAVLTAIWASSEASTGKPQGYTEPVVTTPLCMLHQM